jgi:HSP20 family protein
MARDPIDRIRGEMEELFADLWQVPRFTRRRGGFRPPVDVYRSERGEMTVVVELPGVDPQRIQILVDDQTLVIAGERRRPRCTGRVYQQMELDYGRFQRQIPLEPGIDGEGCKASYRRGVLTIVLPAAKKPSAPARVTISVKAGK